MFHAVLFFRHGNIDAFLFTIINACVCIDPTYQCLFGFANSTYCCALYITLVWRQPGRMDNVIYFMRLNGNARTRQCLVEAALTVKLRIK